MKPHLWRGTLLDDAALPGRIANLQIDLEDSLQTTLEIRTLLDACDKLGMALRDESGEVYRALAGSMKDESGMEPKEIAAGLSEISAFMRAENLEEKLQRELGTRDPFDFVRPDRRVPVFEKWAPLGFLVHVAPTNSFGVGALSVVEGLLTGNVNFLKTGGSDGLFAQIFLKALGDFDPSGAVASKIFACRVSSRDRDSLETILSLADGVAAWGAEGAIEGIRAMTPPLARFVDWGPKISFAYFAADSLDDRDAIERLALDCCSLEQQACSSPQCVYAEAADRAGLERFARSLAAALEKVSPTIPSKNPGLNERAEITSVTELCRLESCLDLTQVIEAGDGSWRVLVEHAGALRTSPLFRTVWVKPIRRDRIARTLRPFRAYLQTAGLACRLESAAELSGALVDAGVLRVTPVGRMLESYAGEPHDGMYALQRYARRVSARLGEEAAGITSFSELAPGQRRPPDVNVMTKEAFQSSPADPASAHLYFKSGGSSGDPKLSVYGYDEYHLQMSAGADGLFANGLDPARDRCMNLFFGGGLYGGFISFFSVLENLGAVQFPMGAHPDTRMVAETIAKYRVNVLLGMPSYIIQLFGQNTDFFKKNPVVEKIFYGGEHFNEAQRRYFQKAFGVKSIRSAAYGSVDAGPIGFQCGSCEGSVHHIHTKLHIMEILDFEKDTPVPVGEPGRVILTSLARAGQRLERYEIGDVARLIPGDCPCGRRAPRFELLGRHGDVFRIGSMFFNYGKFERILADDLEYAGELQIVLAPGDGNGKEELRAILSSESGAGLDPARVRAAILDGYHDLHEAVAVDGVLELSVTLSPSGAFQRTPGSGKLRRIVDERLSGKTR